MRSPTKTCRKIPKMSPRAYIFQRAFYTGLFLEGPIFGGGLSTEGNSRFKMDWASLIVARKFTVFASFYFVFEGNFQVQAPREGLYLEGLIHGGAYFRNITVFNSVDGA